MQHPLIVTESRCARKYSISSFHIAVWGDTKKHICGELLNGFSLNHPETMPWPCEQRKKKNKWPEWNNRRSLCTHKVRALHQRRVNSQDAATQMSRISVIHELALCVTWGHLLSPDEWLLRTADTRGDHVKKFPEHVRMEGERRWRRYSRYSFHFAKTRHRQRLERRRSLPFAALYQSSSVHTELPAVL